MCPWPPTFLPRSGGSFENYSFRHFGRATNLSNLNLRCQPALLEWRLSGPVLWGYPVWACGRAVWSGHARPPPLPLVLVLICLPEQSPGFSEGAAKNLLFPPGMPMNLLPIVMSFRVEFAVADRVGRAPSLAAFCRRS